MTIYIDWRRKTPDKLRDSRNVELRSDDLLVRQNAERALERFYGEYPNKNTGLGAFRAVKSFYKYQGMPLVGIKTPNQEEIAVRIKDRIPDRDEIRKMCDLCDLRNRLIVLIGSQTGMRLSSVIRLQYRHVKEGLESQKIPCRVIVPLYEKEFEKYGCMTFICEDAVKALRDYLKFRADKGETIDDNSCLFPSLDGGAHLTKDGTESIIRKLGINAGITPRDTKGVSEFQFFRKRVQTILESSNIPLNWVDLMLYHKPRGSSASAYSRPSENELVICRFLFAG